MKKKQSPYEKLKVEFENTYGDYLPDEEFQNIYENFKKDGIFSGKTFNWKQYYLKSNGKFGKACAELYKKLPLKKDLILSLK